MGRDAIGIGASVIGEGKPVLVVAEAGVNHNGDLDLAKQLVRAAKATGADCVKFQTFSAARVASASAPKARYQIRTTGQAESQLEMLRRLELDERSLATLRDLCEQEGITFLSTPYSGEDVDVLEALGVPAYKVPSALIVEPDYLRRVASCGKPILLSTGLATLAEVGEAVDVVRNAGNDELVVLQCTTEYPAEPADANLRAMRTMGAAFEVLTGYSDHTISASTAIAAVALGAVVVEKHLTLDRGLPGPDHPTSAEPDEFRAFVRCLRETEAALGDGRKEPSPSEQPNIVSMRRSIVAAGPIRAGATIQADMLATKRPATGIPPRELALVVGRTATVDIDPDQPLEWWMLE